MNTFSISKILCTAVIGVAASTSMLATADTVGETLIQTSAEGLRTMTVSFADLDLSSERAQEKLYYRISGAAHKVCGSSDLRVTHSVRVANENKACYDEAMDTAMSQTLTGQVAVVSN